LERVAVGKVVKPHGIRGEVVVEPLTDRWERFAPGATLFFAGRSHAVVDSREHKGRVLVQLEGVADRSAAERLRGATVESVRDELGEPDTYLVAELVGMSVVSRAGDQLGTVRSLVELPEAAGYDLLEVERDDGTVWLLPAVDEHVAVEEDPTGGERLVLVSPPDGLVEG
jgi:16S rRNA processing protein RimM